MSDCTDLLKNVVDSAVEIAEGFVLASASSYCIAEALAYENNVQIQTKKMRVKNKNRKKFTIITL